MVEQTEITLKPAKRGFNLITNQIADALSGTGINTGVLHLFIKHTSASLCISENADPTVRTDLEAYFNRIVPENEAFYQHRDEGPDDMTSHIKNVILGSSLIIPVTKGRLNLGTWQGIYLCEHRDHARPRKIVLTITGE